MARKAAGPPAFRFELPEPYGVVVADVATHTMGEQARQRAELAKLAKYVADRYGAELSVDDQLVGIVWTTVRRTHEVGICEFWESLSVADLQEVEAAADGSPEA